MTELILSQPIENKGSISAGLKEGGAESVMPQTFWSFEDWMKEAYGGIPKEGYMPKDVSDGGPAVADGMDGPDTLWFIKHVHGTNSKDIECCSSVRDTTMSIIAGALKQKDIMGSTVDSNASWQGMAQRLKKQGIEASPEQLRNAMKETLVANLSKCTEKQMTDHMR